MRKLILFAAVFSMMLWVRPVMAQSLDNDIVIKALKDQMKSTLDSLKLPGYEKPFFVMLGAKSGGSYRILASQGALTLSSHREGMERTSSRILVGDYSFNDESLEDDLFAPSTPHDVPMPKLPDYWAIRRSFWSSIDNVYREGAHHYENHKRAVKETGKKLSDIPHRTFAKSNAVTITPELHPYVFQKEPWEKKVRRLSALYTSHPFITNSYVGMSLVEDIDYLITSEGTVVREPSMRAVFFAQAQAKTAQEENVEDGILLSYTSPDEIPDEKSLAAQINVQIAKLEERIKQPALTEDYTGPVLVMGDVVGEIFGRALLSGGKESLSSNDKIPSLNTAGFEAEFTPNSSRLNKSVASDLVTVKARPSVTEYKGTPLLNAFTVDREGIVPAAETVFIEKGVLKNLFNNRTLTDTILKANGFAGGPGVLEITIDKGATEKELKDRLIKKAKDDGLEFAIIIRNKISLGNIEIYRVSLTDGKEEPLREGSLPSATMKTLKKISGATNQMTAINSSSVSYILPTGVLFSELEIKQKMRRGKMKDEEFVSRPGR